MTRIAVIGARGRIGHLLARTWGQTATFLSRTVGDGYKLADFDRSIVDAPDCRCWLVLSGPTAVTDPNLHAHLANRAIALASNVDHLILMSSAAVYGRATGPLTEELDPTPTTSYGVAKMRLEDVARLSPVPTTILRLGNVAGADALLGNLGPDEPTVDQFEDGTTPIRSYIGPKTLANALQKIADQPPDGVRLLNLAQTPAVSMGDLLSATGRTWTPRPAPAQAIPKVELCLEKLTRLIGPLPNATALDLVSEWHEATA